MQKPDTGMKLYQNGDRCPCCGTILRDKTPGWLAEFSQLVADLGLPEWPGLPESWDADRMLEKNEQETALFRSAQVCCDVLRLVLYLPIGKELLDLSDLDLEKRLSNSANLALASVSWKDGATEARRLLEMMKSGEQHLDFSPEEVIP